MIRDPCVQNSGFRFGPIWAIDLIRTDRKPVPNDPGRLEPLFGPSTIDLHSNRSKPDTRNKKPRSLNIRLQSVLPDHARVHPGPPGSTAPRVCPPCSHGRHHVAAAFVHSFIPTLWHFLHASEKVPEPNRDRARAWVDHHPASPENQMKSSGYCTERARTVLVWPQDLARLSGRGTSAIPGHCRYKTRL